MAKSTTPAATRKAKAEKPAHPLGRSLSDFPDLSDAERELLACCQKGEVATVGDTCPKEETPANTVRADFVRFLALGGDDKAPVHEHGVYLVGAWLTGPLDLIAANAPRRIGLWRCRIEHIDVRQASLRLLGLGGSHLVQGLMGDALHCAGDVFLNNGFHATGEVGFCGATIEGDLNCEGAHFENPGGAALTCDDARVTGRFLFRDYHHPDRKIVPLKVEGSINLCLMEAGSLCDQDGGWGAGQLVLDGFTYGRLAGGGPTDAESRIKWLLRQRPDHLGKAFTPQPWEQLASVLRTMGHADEARKVAVAKHESMRNAGRYVGDSRLWDWIYGNLVGYGYRPWKLFRIAFWVWAFCTLAYLAAVRPSAVGTGTYYLGPPRSEPNAACLVQRAAARSETPCPYAVPRYQDFFAPIYSLEVMLPIINLGGKERWQPVISDAAGRPLFWGHALRILYWLHTAFGWLAGLLLVGVVGTLIKRE